MRVLRAAIIGLGQIGIDFDRLEGRTSDKDIWTHYSAYKALASYFDLVYAVEPFEKKKKAVLEFDPTLKIVNTIDELRDKNIDVVSICTPDEFHLKHLRECVDFCKGILIEKPLFLEANTSEVQNTLNLIQTNKVTVYVNYYKRCEPAVLDLMECLKGQNVLSIICKFSGPLAAVGSHALDLINLVAPIVSIKDVYKQGERISAVFACEKGVQGFLINTGDRYNLIFELEVITSTHRYRLTNNLATFESEAFCPSNRYKNYQELQLIKKNNFIKNPNRLVLYLMSIYKDIIEGTRNNENINLSLLSQKYLDLILNYQYS